MTDKKVRQMSPKGWLHKTTTKAAASAQAFITQYREWLLTGELATFTQPVLLKLDSQEILPTPALEELKAVVLAHHLAEETRKAEEKLNAPAKERTPKAYIATIYNAKGEVQQALDSNGKMKDLTESFDDGTRAEGWCDRRLFDGAPDWFGVVESTKLFRADGTAFAATILRNDAIGRILRKPKAPVMKAQKKSGGRLSFGVKVKPSHASFSRG